MAQQPSGGQGRGKLIGLIAGGAGLVAVIVVVLVLTLGGGSGPESVVRSFYDAARSGDCEQMWSLLAKPSEFPGGESQAKDLFCRGIESGRSEIPELSGTKLVEETDTTAKVEVTGTTPDGDNESEEVSLTKVDGEWKLDLFGSVSGRSSAGG